MCNQSVMAKVKKNAAAVALGRLGALKGGRARARKLTAEQRRARARRAAVLWHAHGRCEMCEQTVPQHGIVLVVDHKVPVEWGGSDAEGNLWAICERCAAVLAAGAPGRRPAGIRAVFLRATAKERVSALLGLKAGHPVPSSLLKAAAGVADWSRCVRGVRAGGQRIVVRRRSACHGGGSAYCMLRKA